jgi:DNA-binding GntR family transcriptional regulator
MIQLESDSLRRQAYRAIRARIVKGEIAPGQIYTVAHFASRLGVSVTPVREALLDLINEGLIEVVRTRGFRVVKLSKKDLDEIFDLRTLLEAPTVARLARRLSAEEMAECRRLEEEIEECAASDDWMGFVETDRQFHLRLLEAYGSKRLVDMVARLRDQSRFHGIRALAQAGELGRTAQEHRLILDAIERGDAAEAEGLMRRHIEHARLRAQAWLSRLTDEAGSQVRKANP